MFSEDQLAAALLKLTLDSTTNLPSETTSQLTERNQKLLLTAMRRYRFARFYPKLAEQIAAATGVAAIELQAALDLLQSDEAKAGEAAKRGGKSAVYFSKSENRQDILEAAFAVLYPLLTLGGASSKAVVHSQTINPVPTKPWVVDEQFLTNYANKVRRT